MTLRPFATAAFVLFATPALADLTAEDVLAAQLNLLSGDGEFDVRTTATETTPTGLRIDGYVMEFDAEGAQHEVVFDGLELREMGDGTVRVIYPDSFDITMKSVGENVDIDEARLTYALDGISHVISGEIGDIRHAISFDRIALDDITMIPTEAIPDTLDYEFSITDGSTIIRLTDTSPLRREISLDMGAMTLRLALPEDPDDTFGDLDTLDAAIELTGLRSDFRYLGSSVPEHSLEMSLDDFAWRQNMTGVDLDSITFAMTADDLEFAYDAALSLTALDDDPVEALAAGNRVQGSTSYRSMSFGMEAETPEGYVSSTSAAGETTGAMRFDRTGILISMESRDNVSDMAIPMSPAFPLGNISYSIARTLIDLDIPLTPSDERLPFRMGVALNDLEISEDLWSIFDPNARLSRDPLNFEFDIDGTTLIPVDPFSRTSSPDELPFKDTEARLNSLRVNVAGAELTGTGEAQDTSIDGVPSGTGRLDLRLTGFNTLLDTLIEMGLMTSDQAMPARMAVGMIARPGDGPDTLVSTIEANSDGSIIANGQRIK